MSVLLFLGLASLAQVSSSSRINVVSTFGSGAQAARFVPGQLPGDRKVPAWLNHGRSPARAGQGLRLHAQQAETDGVKEKLGDGLHAEQAETDGITEELGDALEARLPTNGRAEEHVEEANETNAFTVRVRMPLGIQAVRAGRGFRITRIFKGGGISNLTQQVRAGDFITALNGRPYTTDFNFTQPLGDEVLLTIAPTGRWGRLGWRAAAVPRFLWGVANLPRAIWQRRQLIRQVSRLARPARTTQQVLKPGDSLGEVMLFPLDDVVMGGRSSSRFDNRGRRWQGKVTTQNNGGFAAVRSRNFRPPLDFSAATGVELYVRSGDDDQTQRYTFSLRDSTRAPDEAFEASFDVGPGVSRHRIPFSRFIPIKGSRIATGSTLDLRDIVTVQFLYSIYNDDREANPFFRTGPFKLDILDISLY